MLEIIAIIFLSKKNGKLAVQKGLKSSTWILYSVLCWVAFEVIGIIIGFIFFGQENIMPTYLLALLFATFSYFFIRSILNKKTDTKDEDINRIGVSDLYP
jgi:ABC-type transport system involved in multi-copper enzyme maturation permease subunit